MPGRNDPHTEVDGYFRSFFREWSLAWIRLNIAPAYRPENYPDSESHYFCWYHYFEDNAESQEAAVDLFFNVSRLFFEDFRKKQRTEKLKYCKVIMMTNKYGIDGINEGMMGYIIELYDDNCCEVEFSGSDGNTIACQAIHMGHFALMNDTDWERRNSHVSLL